MKAGGVLLGCVAMLAGAGVAAAFLIGRQPIAPSQMADIRAPAPQPLEPPPPAPQPSVVNFVPLVQNFSLVRDSAAYVAASQNAPQFYPLKAGTGVVSAARSPDGAWTVAMTADGRAAFIPSGDLGAYDPSLAPQAPLPQTISGEAQVVDTATLVVNGQTVPLVGVLGSGGAFAAQMQSLIGANGSQVTCTLEQGGHYVCMLPSGQDLARSALFNGAADVADDASADYREQADAARTAHRGRWK